MAVIETWFNQDLQKPVKVQYLDGSLFSNNGNGNRIGVNVFDNGEAVTLTGTVSGYVVLSNGTTVPCTGARSGNKASILIPPAAYVSGSVFISIFITDGTTVTTLAAVSSSVLLARTDTQVDPGTVVADWTQTINGAMQSVEDAAENLGHIVATPYAELTYPVPLGKYTYYNDNLYKCVSPIPTSEEFTPAHWSSDINLGDEVNSLKDNPVFTGSLSMGRAENSTVGITSTALGYDVTASGDNSHAEGTSSSATSEEAHAEGLHTTASGNWSHSEGSYTTASGSGSHAEGKATIANHLAQHVFGTFNVADTSTASSDQRGNYIEIVGNGAIVSERSNARTLDWNGNETLSGDLTVGKGTNNETSVIALKSALNGVENELGIIDDYFEYTASSGYQKTPYTIAPGVYLVTVSNVEGQATPALKDSNENTVWALTKGWNDHELTITQAQSEQIAMIVLYLGNVRIKLKSNRCDILEEQISTFDSRISENESDISDIEYETGLYDKTFTYTASSGYQNIPMTIAAGNYYTKILSGNSTANLRDKNGNVIKSIIGSTSAWQNLTITEEEADKIVEIRLYQTNVRIRAITSGKTSFYCGPNRELSTLKAGIEEATLFMNSVLYVDPGTYDLVQEFGADYFANLTSSNTFAGLFLKNNIHVIFSPNSKVVSHYTGNNEYALTRFSPFNNHGYGFTLENLTLECSRCRYCVHDERSGGVELCKSHYINCKMYIDNHENAEWTLETCIGGGLGSNHSVIVEECVFDNYGDQRGGVYFHLSNDQQNPNHCAIVAVRDNYFIHGTVVLQISRTDGTLTTRFLVNGNSIPKIYSGAGADGIWSEIAAGANVEICSFNNLVRGV